MNAERSIRSTLLAAIVTLYSLKREKTSKRRGSRGGRGKSVTSSILWGNNEPGEGREKVCQGRPRTVKYKTLLLDPTDSLSSSLKKLVKIEVYEKRIRKSSRRSVAKKDDFL